jgi:Domain of unknown function (DUF6249)
VEHMVEVLVPITFFAMIAAIFLGPAYLRSRDRARMHETLRIAYEKGQPVPPELIAALQSNVVGRVISTPERDLRRAIILIAVGLGFCAMGYGLWFGLMSVNYTAAYTTGSSVAVVGAIPGLIGLAYLLLWATKRNAPKA